jgi:hypothetical protein
MDNLPELRDIHLPTEEISIFPLAYGWWIILLAILLLFAFIKLVILIRRNSKKIYAKYLLEKKASGNGINDAVNMSEILRRICLNRYPEAVSFVGDKWIDFINSKAKNKLSEKSARLLKDAPYIPTDTKTYTESDVIELRKFCFDWIGDNL